MQDRPWDTYDPAAEPGVKPFTGWENYDPEDSGEKERPGEPEGSGKPQVREEAPHGPEPEEGPDAACCTGREEPDRQVSEEPEDRTAEDGAEESLTETEEETGEAPDRDWEIRTWLTQMNLRLEQLDRKFNEKIKTSESQDVMARTLYAEVQEYKKGMYADILKPLLLELVQLRNNIFRQCRSIMEKEGRDAVIPVEKLMDYGEDVGDVLETYDVEIFCGEPGTDFDPRMQKLLKKVSTTEEALNKKVAASLCDGYRYKGRTIMKENVKVYVYEPEKTAENA